MFSKSKLMEFKGTLEELKLKNAEAKEKRDRNMREAKADSERLINEWNFKIAEREKIEKEKLDRESELLSQM